VMSEVWRQIDLLQQLEKVPRSLPEYVVKSENVVTVDHICGPMCVHLRANDNGSYTCELSGLCFGRQIAAGSNEYGTAILDFNHGTAPTRSPACSNVGRPEMFSAACGILSKLVDARERLALNESKTVKARKVSSRAAAAMFRDTLTRGDPVHWMGLLQHACSAFESSGGGVRRRVFTSDRRTEVASLVADLHQVLIIPYSKVDKKKPNKEFYVVSMLYLLAEGLGEASRVDSDILTATLPPEKLLKSLGVCVSRVTAAKRYVKDALAHLNEMTRKRKREVAQRAEQA